MGKIQIRLNGYWCPCGKTTVSDHEYGHRYLMVTSPNEWKIIEWDGKLQTNKQSAMVWSLWMEPLCIWNLKINLFKILPSGSHGLFVKFNYVLAWYCAFNYYRSVSDSSLCAMWDYYATKRHQAATLQTRSSLMWRLVYKFCLIPFSVSLFSANYKPFTWQRLFETLSVCTL